MTSRSKTKLALIVVLGAIAVGYLATSIYFEKHFFPGSSVNGIQASGKSATELEEEIKKNVSEYKLTIVEEDREDEEISASEVGLEIDLSGGEVGKYLSGQNGFTWPVSVFKNTEYGGEQAVSLNEDMLQSKVDSLDCVVNKGKKSQNATYKLDGDKFVIVDEVYGTRLKKSTLFDAVKTAMTSLKDSLDLREDHIYKEPSIKKDNKKLVKAVGKLNNIMGVNVTYTVGNTNEVLDKVTQASFLKVGEKNKIEFDDEKMLEYIKSMGRKYNTFSIAREFKTSYGKTVTVPSGGDYGWWMNYPEELKQLKKDLKGGKDVQRDFIYYNQAASHDKPDYGNSYVEVNIATQHLFLIIDGKKVLESDVVSGNTSRGNGTPLGTFRIAYKEKDATLNGENYSTPVKWWMPFFYNVGLHDANWRSNFGGQIYKTSGSHGCVNLPPAIAEKIFGYVEAGFPVIVYEYNPNTKEE